MPVNPTTIQLGEPSDDVKAYVQKIEGKPAMSDNPTTKPTVTYRVCSGVRCKHYLRLCETGVCCGDHTDPLPEGVVVSTEKPCPVSVAAVMATVALVIPYLQSPIRDTE